MFKIGFVGMMLLLLTACTTTTGKSLLTLKEELVATHEAFRVPCKTGVVPKEVCNKVDVIFNKAKPIYDTAVDLYLINGTVDTSTITPILADLTALAIQYKLSK